MTEETLFHEALSKAPIDRSAFLAEKCAGDPALRAAVEALLAAHDASGSFLNRPAGPLDQTVDSEPGAVSPGATGEFTPEPDGANAATTDHCPKADASQVIGARYTLLQRIGEGGMGEVWVAQQTDPVKRKVALKLIKTGMDSKGVLARFEQERQALAIMDHPNIARVLDGGMTPTGQPFFVMELVNGLALTKFCDEARLTPRQRLELFIPICQAVQHAHQKGIVHRDLKPANILVTMIDGRPVPKVIDFGVAKATGANLTDEGMNTQFGAVVGTLEYMSPEQAGFSGVDIDTRADIYSLGVVLFELLTGLRPIDSKRLKKAALAEMIRIIQEEEPSKPSTRLSTDEALPSLAAIRQTDPHKLLSQLKGELDWIVMKCLEKSRDRRYDSANDLARDVQRYLADEPVEARPPSAAYRLKKFVRRHKGQVIAASLVFVALLGGIVGTSLGMVRAEIERKRAADLAEKNEGLAEDEKQAKLRATELANKNAKLAADEQDAKKAALEAKQETERQLRRIQAVMFSNQMAKAAEVSQQNPSEATKLLYDLEAIPIHMRDAAWRLLARSCEQRVQLSFLPDILAGPTTNFAPDGTRTAIRKTREDTNGERVLATVTIHEVSTGKVLLTIPEEPDRDIGTYAFSPDGTKFVQVVDPKARFKPVDPKAVPPVIRSDQYLPSGTLEVRVWDIPSGKIVSTFSMSTFSVARWQVLTGRACAFSPDGRLLAVSEELNTLRIWDIQANRIVTTLKGHADQITTVAISRDGKRIATSGIDFMLKLWDGSNGALLATLTPANDNTTPEFLTDRKMALLRNGGKPIRDFVTGLDFSPDGGSLAASYSNWLIEVWDVAKGKSKDVIRGLKQRPGAALYDAAGKSLFVGGHSRWDIATGRMLFTLNLSEQMAAGGKLITSTDRTRWGVLQGRRVTWVGSDAPDRDATKFVLTDTAESVRKMAFSPDNRLLAVPCGNRIEMIDLRTGKTLPPLMGPKMTIAAVAFSPNGRILAASCSQTQHVSAPVDPKGASAPPPQRDDIYLFDVPSGALLGVLPAQEFAIGALDFSPDGKTLASIAWRPAIAGAPAPRSERHASITLWDVTNRKSEGTLEFLAREALPMGVTALKFHPKNGTLAAAAGETVTVWDLATKTHRAVPTTSSGPRFIAKLDFSADGDTLFIAIPGIGGSTTDATQCTNLKTGESETRFVGQGYFQGVTPDGKTAVLSTQNKVTFWNTHTFQLLHTFNVGAASLVAVAQDGRAIASVEHDPVKKTVAVKVWDTGNPERFVSLPQMIPSGFTPDSKTLVLKRDDTFYLWDLQAHQVRRTVPTSRGSGAAFRLSPDGRFVALSGGFGRFGQEGSIELFDLTTGAKVATIPTGTGLSFRSTPMAFSPDSRTLAFLHADTGKAEGAKPPAAATAVNLWDVRENRLIRTIPLPPRKGGPSLGGTFGIAFTRDSHALAVHTPDGATHVNDLRDPAKPAVVLPAPEADAERPYFTGLAFTPDGARLAVRYSSNYGDLNRHAVWDWRTAKRIEGVAVADLFAPRVPNSMVSPDGRFEAVSEVGGCYLIDRTLHPKK